MCTISLGLVPPEGPTKRLVSQSHCLSQFTAMSMGPTVHEVIIIDVRIYDSTVWRNPDIIDTRTLDQYEHVWIDFTSSHSLHYLLDSKYGMMYVYHQSMTVNNQCSACIQNYNTNKPWHIFIYSTIKCPYKIRWEQKWSAMRSTSHQCGIVSGGSAFKLSDKSNIIWNGTTCSTRSSQLGELWQEVPHEDPEDTTTILGASVIRNISQGQVD